MKKKDIIISDKYLNIIKLILIISSVILSNTLQHGLLMKYRIISSILVFIITFIILKQFKLDKLNKTKLLCSTLIALYTSKFILGFANNNPYNLDRKILILLLFLLNGRCRILIFETTDLLCSGFLKRFFHHLDRAYLR